VRYLSIAFLVLVSHVCHLPAFAQQNDAAARNRVVAQADAPISITEYKSSYTTGSQYTTQGIHHDLKYVNSAKKTIVAIEFGLVSFDIFNDFADRTYGIDKNFDKRFQEGTKEASGGWVARALNESFHWTGVVWVKRVRFENGEIWKADEQSIVAELKKIQANFDASVLAPDAWKKTTQD
jgi:hypothetical protein